MVLKEEQLKMQALLKDTITLLCRNGLEYNTEFCVEALIGITLDKDKVVLVNINETVRSPNAPVEEPEPEKVQRPEGPTSSTPSRKRSHSTHDGNIKAEDDSGGGGDEDDDAGGDYSEESSVKRFKSEAEQEDDESEDIIVIKEELDTDTWESQYGATSSTQGDYTGDMQQYGGDADLSQVLQGGSLDGFSGATQGDGTGWTGQGTPMQQRRSASATATQGNTGDQQQVGTQGFFSQWHLSWGFVTPHASINVH